MSEKNDLKSVQKELQDFKPGFRTVFVQKREKEKVIDFVKELKEKNTIRDDLNLHFFEKVAFVQYQGKTSNLLDEALDFYLMRERMRGKSKIEKLNSLVHYIKVNKTEMFIFIKEGPAGKEEKAAMSFLGNFAKIMCICLS